ncbi:MAG: phosphoenolpyruvate carboxykinase, partial [Mycobacterium sp.]
LDASRYGEQKIAAALAVDLTEWQAEISSIEQWYATIGDNRLPGQLQQELADLKHRIATAGTTTGSPRRGLRRPR